ncbi:acyltransferase family protein [Blautia sp. HCP3S3_G3]|uniref:acyltransferase family protein n=1 Tax=Blautia sp. HCP3S3_G3 TaxID=3438913 RepID=UPI003F8BE745
MKEKNQGPALPYSYLVDNIKVLLIYLVVFNHMIAFQLVKDDMAVRHVWYAITIFHMPAFVFVSGYLCKKPQNVLKNVKNLLIPYILGYSLTWYAYIWCGNSMDYELLRPSGSAMWYLLALFMYRLTIEGLGKVRFAVPLSILFALWAGTRPEFSTYLSASRIVVFFPFFVAGYLWDSRHTQAVRRFKGKWVLLPVSVGLLFAVPHYMISSGIPVDIFRGNHSYLMCGLTDEMGIIMRLLMYLISFVLILTFLAILPDRKLPLTFIGRNTMGIYFFHYPVMIVMSGLLIFKIPQLGTIWAVLGLSLIFVLVLGSPPVDFLYNVVLKILTLCLFKREKEIKDEGLEDEYDSDDELQYELVLKQRRKAIEELAATLETETNGDPAQDVMQKPSQDNSGESREIRRNLSRESLEESSEAPFEKSLEKSPEIPDEPERSEE